MPGIKFLVIGVLPQGKDPHNPRRDQIKDLNQKLEHALANEPNVKFVDVGAKMLEKDGSMSDKVWWGDGFHPRNYTPMFDAIKPELSKF